MTPLRFCSLTTFYPPFNFGGDGIDVQRTARALVARGHEVTVIHDVDAYEWLSGVKHPPQPVRQEGVEVIGLRSRLGVLSPLLTHQVGRPVVHGATMRALLAARRPDVVLFNNVSLVGGPGTLDLGGNALKVYIAHEHWLVCPTHVLWRFNREPCDERACTRCVLTYRRPPQLWRYTSALARRLPQVDLFIARSEFSRRKHLAYGFPRAMHVLPYFLPGTLPEQLPPRTPTRPHPRPYFLFVGRLTRLKGLDSVIPAIGRRQEADLLIVGDGEEGQALRELGRGCTNIHFLGRLANDQLRAYYEHAVAAIVPSRGYETFGIVLIEAMRFGTPVIARRVGPLPEIVAEADAGEVFSTEAELCEAMDRLQHDPVRRDRLGRNGYEACRRYWSEEVVVGRLLELIATARQRQ